MACSLTLEEHGTFQARNRIATLVKNTVVGKKRPMAVISKISPTLCRAARGLLDMPQIELAAGASVSKNTIVDFENGRSTPVKNNLAAIQRVPEEAGVEFTNGDAPGRRLRKKKR
jgi:DNA-binding XRE family transcriptional regulator